MPLQPLIPTSGTGRAGECPPIIAKLSEFAALNPETQRTKLALLGRDLAGTGAPTGFFRSEMNAQWRGLNEAITGTSGAGIGVGPKLRSVRLNWLKRNCTSDLANPATLDPCDAEVVEEYEDEEIVFDGPIVSAAKLSFTMHDWIRMCETGDEGLLRRIQTKINAILTDHEAKLFAAMINGAGANINYAPLSGGSPGEWATINQIINPTNGTINYNVYQKLREDFYANEMEDVFPAVFFNYTNDLRQFLDLMRFGCCNDIGVSQMEIAGALGMAPFMSKTLRDGVAAWDAELGNTLPAGVTAANTALVVHPGSAHLLEWFRFGGEYAFQHGQSFGRLYTDPISGEQFDMQTKFDDCTTTMTMTISKTSQIWTMPTDAYQECDELSGANGIFLYNFSK